MSHPLYAKPKFVLEHIINVTRKSAGEAQNTPVLLRAINLLKSWVEHYWADFTDDPELLLMLTSCVEEFENQKLFQMLKNVMKRKVPPQLAS